MSGWSFPARTSAYFLIVATMSMAALAVLGLREVQQLNADHVAVRVDRAARAGSALFVQQNADFIVDVTDGGSIRKIQIDSIDSLVPSDSFDSLVDSISAVNQGAANIFRFDLATGQFDRISTSFKDAEGARIGASQVEPGLIGETHPAYASLTRGEPYVGEVPVAGQVRAAYLTPIFDARAEMIGVAAVDVGRVDDLNRINSVVTNRAVALVLVLLGLMAVAGVVVMFFVFRPLNRLIRIAHKLGSDDPPESIQLTDRRDEIGHLAQGLSLVVELRRDLEHRAYTDPLTDIANRGAFVRELERRFSRLADGGQPELDGFALLILDLDGFKEVNDGLGHQAGDELLVSLAASLNEILQPGEFLARLGGDEFAVLTAPGVIEVQEVEAVAQRTSASVTGVRQTHAGDTSMTASIGAALVPEHGMTSGAALSRADLALYSVKRGGRGHAQIYEPQMASPVQRRMHLATQLRRAMADGLVRLEYQPLYDARTGQLRSVEALARWTHDIEGEIPPLEFIRVAETAGMINELGGYVLEEACTQIERWRQLGLHTPTIAVNVSTMQLWQSDFIEQLQATMRRHEIEPEALCLELTGSVLVHHEHAQHQHLLQELAALGIGLSIDDFGSGYSSLSYLHDLPVDYVKIDRAFLAEAANDEKRGRLFGGIVTLAHKLGLVVVAEGVETTAELALAQRCGCDLVQGFYLDSPKHPEVVSSRFGRLHSHWSELALQIVT
ncbi:MAG: diguanylate cyclase (GGDEF)-like protein [Minisyncoccia bacterium]|jgi:diguanylate cyclase (GGDEF)-like protein